MGVNSVLAAILGQDKPQVLCKALRRFLMPARVMQV